MALPIWTSDRAAERMVWFVMWFRPPNSSLSPCVRSSRDQLGQCSETALAGLGTDPNAPCCSEGV